MARRNAALDLAPKTSRDAGAAASISTPAGASASVQGESIVVRNQKGAIVVVFDAATGHATLSAPGGDLRLEAPHGRVVVSAGADLELASGNRINMQCAQLDIDSGTTSLRGKLLELTTEAIAAVSPSMTLSIGRFHLNAQRVVEHASDAYRTIDGLLETRAGRIRSVVQGATQWFSRSTSIVSEEDSFMDGRRVLLG